MKKYYPFLVAASHYVDYWAVICPQNIRPMIIAKAAIRGPEFGIYSRKIIYENKKYEVTYKFAPILSKYQTGNEQDIEILRDNSGGRPIHMFYGVFGVDLPKNSKLFDEAEQIIFSYLFDFLNDSDRNFSVISKPLEKGSELKNDLEFIELEPLIIDDDVFISPRSGNTIKVETVHKEDNFTKKKVESLDIPNIAKPTVLKEDNNETKKKEDISFRKFTGTALTFAGLGISLYSGTISLISALVTGTGVFLILNDNKPEKNKED